MFRLQLANNKIIKDCFEAISTIIDEVIIECDTEGLRLRALDRSHITFISLDLKAIIFDEYICEEPTKICIDTAEFMKVLKRCKNNDLLGLNLDEGNLIITFTGDATRTFKIRLIDLEYDTPTLPAIEYNTHIELPVDILNDTIKDIEIFSDRITITVNEDYAILNGDGEFGDTEMKYIHGGDVTESVRSIFSLEKIREIMKASKITDYCDLKIGNDKPLHLKFDIENESGCMEFLLAPRLEDEGE